MQCWFCQDSGFWVDCVQQKTLWCPYCQPGDADGQANALITDFTDWYPSLWPIIEAKHYGPKFQTEPWLLVLHCAGNSRYWRRHVAHYFEQSKRSVSTHWAWDDHVNGFAQCVPLGHVAWHVGGSKFRGSRRLNFQSVGVEWPGPPSSSRSEYEKHHMRSLVKYIIQILPVTTVVKHSDIDSTRKDPGLGVYDLLKDLGLDMPFKDSHANY